MSLYYISLVDRTGHILDNRSVEAADVPTALAQANTRLWTILQGPDRAMLDPRGRVDVLDQRGAPVARIHCAEALVAMS